MLCSLFNLKFIFHSTFTLKKNLFQQRMKQFGCQITTSENVIFKLMADAKHLEFKKVQALVKKPSDFIHTTPISKM